MGGSIPGARAGILMLSLALLCTPALASDFGFYAIGDNRFDARVDLGNLNWFDRGLYKAALPFQDCIDLDEFYAYADSNPFDNLDRSSIYDYRDRLSYSDYKTFSGINSYDSISPRDYRIEDMRCSNHQDFQDWAKTNPNHSDDDYYSLFGFSGRMDYEQRYDHYPAYDHIYPVDAYSIVRTDGFGGFASWIPLDRSW